MPIFSGVKSQGNLVSSLYPQLMRGQESEFSFRLPRSNFWAEN